MAWTEITRAKYRRDGLRYASDTTDEEWAVIERLMPPAHGRGRPRETSLRDIVNAIFYIAQSCCQWRMLPKEFPPFTTVQYYFYRWRNEGTWLSINHALVMLARELEAREASPSAGVIDSQSVKSRPSPSSATGSSKSSGAAMPPRASSSCPGDGSSSAPSPGSTATVVSPRTSKQPSKAHRPGS